MYHPINARQASAFGRILTPPRPPSLLSLPLSYPHSPPPPSPSPPPHHHRGPSLLHQRVRSSFHTHSYRETETRSTLPVIWVSLIVALCPLPITHHTLSRSPSCRPVNPSMYLHLLPSTSSKQTRPSSPHPRSIQCEALPWESSGKALLSLLSTTPPTTNSRLSIQYSTPQYQPSDARFVPQSSASPSFDSTYQNALWQGKLDGCRSGHQSPAQTTE